MLARVLINPRAEIDAYMSYSSVGTIDEWRVSINGEPANIDKAFRLDRMTAERGAALYSDLNWNIMVASKVNTE